MADVLLFHHAHGLTGGVIEFADRLRQAGHHVTTPDLYGGATFDDLEAGVGHAEQIGFETIIERGVAAAAGLPDNLVYAGFSLGVLPAQKLAQTRAGAAGAILVSACVPPEMLGGDWPNGVPVQVHGMEDDPFFAGEGDLDAARQLVDGHDDRQLFVSAGRAHLFADSSLDDHDESAAAVLIDRVLDFLGSLAGR